MAAVEATNVDKVGLELQAILGDRVSRSQSVRDHHGKDESWHHPVAPDIVAFPHTTEEVAAIVKICAENATPVIPFGAGTSLEGHVIADRGGVCIDLMQMDQVLEVNGEDLDCRVQPGVTRKQLNSYLRDMGLFFPIDPGANASIGGMTATRASGTNAVRYGTMRENVLALTVVLSDGRIIKTSRRARKSSAGYDLTRLFVGSEGTLGVITEITLRLYGIPEAITSAIVSFPELKSAVDSVISTIQMGIPIARIELLDKLQVQACNSYSGLGLAEQPTLFLEFHGTSAGAEEQAKLVGEIAAEFGGGDFQWTGKLEERNKLWEARHNAAYAAQSLRPGCQLWATDVCVPISRLADCIMETQEDLAGSYLIAPLVGHVGDGNFHLTLLIDPEKPEELEEANRINDRLVMRALAMEGTCTGEHGIGSGKIKFLQAEHGDAVAAMRTLKLAFDPQNIMNPGKIVSL